MQLKTDKEINSTRKLWLILLIFIFMIVLGFIIAGQIPWVFFIILVVFIALFCSSAFWQAFVFPGLKLSDHFALTRDILQFQFFKTPLMLSIKNGEIEGDFVHLQKKPIIHLMNVDHKSALLIEDLLNKKYILFHGLHISKNSPKILGVFSLGVRELTIGPAQKEELEPRKIQESIAEFHSRINTAEKTKTDLISDISIYPSLKIFYRLELFGKSSNDLEQLINLVKRFGRDSVIFTSHDLEKSIINEVLDSWRRYCKNKNLESVLSEFPGIFEPADIKITGIKYRIYINQIY